MSGRERPEAIDSDVDLHVPAQRAETAGGAKWPVLAVISAGGALGASARYGLALAWPVRAGGFPWSTLLVNVLGCALIGVLMPLISEGGRRAHHLVRPFLGVGVLGGFTTFSTYAVEVSRLLARQQAGPAMAYAAGTLLGALGAVWAAATVTRRALAARAGAGYEVPTP
ncbi:MULTISPECIES: CrcB family protein [unclassified Streptomyces]|uniref:Fluoride-specific ion channel FluC n=1 Tax=Streptomyces sp. NBC_00060 TaxID=2975636 RepID=A0AAU2GYY7_9ACTN